jgi:ferrous iron transport protein B
VTAGALRLALVGAPNSGKTTLFNGLTGGLAKTANYAGTTVETRSGKFETPGGAIVTLVDLPGIYGLQARSTDERVAVEAILGKRGEPSPDALILVADAANLRTHLHTVLQMKMLGLPVIVALNMMDLAERDGVKIDVPKLSALLGVPVVPTRATRKAGREQLVARIDDALKDLPPSAPIDNQTYDLRALQREARRIADETLTEPAMNKFTRALDAVLLHPIAGVAVLVAVLFVVFQAVFAWATPLMDMIEVGFAWLQATVSPMISDPILHGFIVDAAINGVGSVVVFLPQIVILFAFILFLEASGYMARAAFLMDELMLRVGLNGRAFIPLLSSFACAIPGIMAARTIEEERDRITTIMVAPLMTCSARLPVYTLLIGVFIPSEVSVGPFNLQGLVLFGLYALGVVSAVAVAFILKRTATKGPSQPLIMELPTYKLPVWRDFFLGLVSKAWAFLKRAGTIIFGTTLALWVLAYFPNGGAGLEGSYAGMIGRVIEPIFKPIGFNLEMVVALIPGMAAREAAVSSLGLIYSLGPVDETSQALQTTLSAAWSLPMALSFIAWYVYAPQCFATLATVRRETNSWKWTGFLFAYLIGLAYVASLATFWIATAAGL